MADKAFIYEICVQGQLGEHWSDWFEGMTLTQGPQEQAVLRDLLRDQTALEGIFKKRIGNLDLDLISEQRCKESYPDPL